VIELRNHILEVIDRAKVTLKQLQSLSGSLLFVSKTLPAGRVFFFMSYLWFNVWSGKAPLFGANNQGNQN
jgi:hypothetical protein